MKLQLIEGAAGKWWRLWSMWVLAAAAALQAEIILYPDALKGYLPDEWMHRISLALLLLAAASRLMKQGIPQ